MFSSEAPMVRLLAGQARRRGFHRWGAWAAFSALLLLVPTGLAACFGATGSVELRSFVYTFACLLAGLVPLGKLSGDAALLASLRKGRCLEEIVGTRTPASEMVDQVASYSVLSVLQMGCAVGLPLLVSLSVVAPAEHRGLLAAACLAWFPVAALLVLVGSYLVQASAVWSSDSESGAALAALLMGLVLILGGGLTTCLWDKGPGSLLAGLAGLACLATVYGILGFAARAFAIRGLNRGVQAPGSGRVRRGWTTRFAPGFYRENPVALREEARRRRSLPLPAMQRLGLPGYLLARHWLVWLGVALLFTFSLASYSQEVGFLVAPLGGLVLCLFPLLASSHTAQAAFREREGGTLEALAATGIEARTFVDGWAMSAWMPRLAEALLLLSAAALVLGTSRPPVESLGSLGFLVAYVPDWLLRIVFGAYLGLVVSCLARTRRDLGLLLVLLWVAVGVGQSMVTGFLFAALQILALGAAGGGSPGLWLGLYACSSLGISLLAILGVRWLALYQVRLLLGPRR